MVTVRGGNFIFSAGLGCWFDTVLVSASYASNNEISCFSPAHDIGLSAFSITNNGIDRTEDGLQFEYALLPIVSGITPKSGPVGSQTVLTVTGSGFISGSTWCRFGASEIIQANVISHSQVTCTVTNFFAAVVDISVTTNSLDFSVEKISFEFSEAPQFFSVHPNLAPSISNDRLPVRITGEDFRSTQFLMCLFD